MVNGKPFTIAPTNENMNESPPNTPFAHDFPLKIISPFACNIGDIHAFPIATNLGGLTTSVGDPPATTSSQTMLEAPSSENHVNNGKRPFLRSVLKGEALRWYMMGNIICNILAKPYNLFGVPTATWDHGKQLRHRLNEIFHLIPQSGSWAVITGRGGKRSWPALAWSKLYMQFAVAAIAAVAAAVVVSSVRVVGCCQSLVIVSPADSKVRTQWTQPSINLQAKVWQFSAPIFAVSIPTQNAGSRDTHSITRICWNRYVRGKLPFGRST